MERKLTIEGMMCQHCVKTVRKSLEALGTTVTVDLEAKTATVAMETVVSDADLKNAVEAKGFQVIAID